jgi:hypothetical protein
VPFYSTLFLLKLGLASAFEGFLIFYMIFSPIYYFIPVLKDDLSNLLIISRSQSRSLHQ